MVAHLARSVGTSMQEPKKQAHTKQARADQSSLGEEGIAEIGAPQPVAPPRSGGTESEQLAIPERLSQLKEKSPELEKREVQRPAAIVTTPPVPGLVFQPNDCPFVVIRFS